MERLKFIESKLDEVSIFVLLEYLKELAVYENNEGMMKNYGYMIIGLIERVQENIVLGNYK